MTDCDPLEFCSLCSTIRSYPIAREESPGTFRIPRGVIVFDVVMLLNDTFMMPVLFFVSGHLLPLSWWRPPRTFIVVKARRLLLPLCVSIVFLGSIIAYARAMAAGNGVDSYLNFWFYEYLDGSFEHFHYWFLGVLFLFMVLARYGRSWLVSLAGRRKFFKHFAHMEIFWLYCYMILVGFLSLIVTLLYSFEGWINFFGFLVFQPSRIPLYCGFFLLGILTAKSAWGPEKTTALPTFRLIIPFTVLLSVSLVVIRAPGVLPENAGLVLSASLYPAVGVSWFLILVRVAMAMDHIPYRFGISRASYGIYLLHLPILIVLQYMALDLAIGPGTKAFLFGLVAVVFSYLLTHLLLRLPGVRSVL